MGVSRSIVVSIVVVVFMVSSWWVSKLFIVGW